MRISNLTLLAVPAGVALASNLPISSSNSSNLVTCLRIEAAISSASQVYWPGSSGYANDTEHWVPSSAQNSTCTVEPGSVQDVAAIVKVLNTVTTPFGVKSGGHAISLGFSSSTGVLIALSRLNQVVYNATGASVKLGMGNTWDKVYASLNPYNVTVSGGRVTGVGVGGYLLGGGYAWISNKYGLSFDSVLSYELVLPSGAITTASATVNPDLFWGLKGGFNNFGIVTSAVVKAYPNPIVYAGLQTYVGASIPMMAKAMAAYFTMQAGPNAIPEGNCDMTYEVVDGVETLYLSVFYAGPVPPPALFAAFKDVPMNASAVNVQSFSDYIAASSAPYLNSGHLRGTFQSVSINNLTETIITTIIEQVRYYGTTGSFGKGTIVSTDVEPFIPANILRPDTDAVYPHSVFASPLNLYWAWPDESMDAAGLATIDAAGVNITNALRAEGQPVDEMVLYPNYARGNTPVEKLYGTNLPKAKTLRKKYDPNGVMLRTGGYKFV